MTTATTTPSQSSTTGRPANRTRVGRSHPVGAPLLPPAVVYAVLTVLAVAIPSAVAGEGPWTSDSALLDFFRNHGGAAHASAFFTLAAAVPIAVFTAVSTTRLRTLGLDVPGRIIAQIGGTLASAMLAIAGLSTLAATQSHVADSDSAIRALYGITFAAGGPAFVMFSGLLVAGVSIPGLIGRVMPRWLAWAGLVLAVVSEVASLSAAFDGLDVLLPIGRFGGLAWIVVTGFVLPATRRELRERKGIVRQADITA